MDIASLRTSFNVTVVESSIDRGSDILEVMQEADFTVDYFTSHNDCLSGIRERPPHVVIVSVSDDPTTEDIIREDRFIKALLQKVPECHIIVLVQSEGMDYGLAFYEKGAYDVISLPLVGTEQLVKAVDRAIEKDYYTYLNEQLKERELQNSNSSDSASAISMALMARWSYELLRKKSLTEIITHLCSEVHKEQSCEVVYFKYIDSQGTLVAAHTEGLAFETIRGIGINFISSGKKFFRDQLHLPASLMELKELVQQVFNEKCHCAVSFVVHGEVKGVIVALGKEQTLAGDDSFKLRLTLAEERAGTLQNQNKLQRVENLDRSTNFLNQSHFVEAIRLEISRSRRIQLPTALQIYQINLLSEAPEEIPVSEKELVMKSVSKVLKENFRHYDIFGRLGAQQLAILLPHTDREGAAIKAERMRRILESIDYSEFSPSVASVTVSVGVSEYPSLSQDAHSILLSADEALGIVVEGGKNRVCLASVSDSFVPDFMVSLG